MKNMKKLAAIVLALVMVLSLTATAFAEDFDGDGDPAVTSATGLTSLTLDVNFTPEAGLTTPAYTFTYSIAAGSGKDAGDGPEVKAGIGTLTITTSAAFAATETNKKLTISGIDNVLTAAGTAGPGIYRYKITQAQISNDGISAGILNDKGNGAIEVRYLDLYVEKDAAAASGYKVSGAVLFKSDVALNALSGTNTDTEDYTTNLVKVSSFENTFGKAGNDNPDPDDPNYPQDPNDPKPSDSGKHTVTVTKTVTGNMGSTTQQFPFIVEVESNGLSLVGASYEIDKAGTKTNVTFDSTTSQGQFTLANGESVVITVPNNIDVKVQETIEIGEGYTVYNQADAAAKGLATWATGWQIPDDQKLEDENGISFTLDDAADGDKTIDYTNKRETISPTGVILRVAPFAMILAVGCFFFLVAKRRKDEDEVEA